MWTRHIYSHAHTHNESCYNVISQVPLCYAHFKYREHLFRVDVFIRNKNKGEERFRSSLPTKPTLIPHALKSKITEFLEGILRLWINFSALFFLLLSLLNCYKQCVKQCAVLRQWAKCKFFCGIGKQKKQFDRKKCHQMLLLLVSLWTHNCWKCELLLFDWARRINLCTFPIHTDFLAN